MAIVIKSSEKLEAPALSTFVRFFIHYFSFRSLASVVLNGSWYEMISDQNSSFRLKEFLFYNTVFRIKIRIIL